MSVAAQQGLHEDGQAWGLFVRRGDGERWFRARKGIGFCSPAGEAAVSWQKNLLHSSMGLK